MITAIGNVQSIQTSIGRLTKSRCSFRSTTSLAGQVIKFSPALFLNTQSTYSGNTYSFTSVYGSGVNEMFNTGSKNIKAFIEVVNDYNFNICLEFIAGLSSNGYAPNNQTLNSDLLSGGDFNGFVGFSVLASNDNQVHCFTPINVKGVGRCDLTFTMFDEDGNQVTGYQDGKDLIIRASTFQFVNNNFFAGFYDKTISNSTDVFNGLSLSYAQINSGASAVNDTLTNPYPNACISDGQGFTNNGSQTVGEIVIPASCFVGNSLYGAYFSYQVNGEWKTCLIDISKDENIYANLDIEVTVIDDFGNTASGNVASISNCIPLDICATIDDAAFLSDLQDLGITTTIADALVSVSVFSSNTDNAVSGTNIPSTNTDADICIDQYRPSGGFTGDQYINFKWVFDVNGCGITYIHTVKLGYIGSISETPLIQDPSGVNVDAICIEDEDDYKFDSDISSCRLFSSMNGADYSSYPQTNAINPSLLSIGEFCIKKVCSEMPTTDEPCEPTECPPCEPYDVEINIEIDEDGFANIYIQGMQTLLVSGSISGTPFTNSTSTSYGADPGGSITITSIEATLPNGCVYLFQGNRTVNAPSIPPGQASISTNFLPTTIVTPTEECEQEPCDEPVVCDNSGNFIYDCDEDTGTINVSYQPNYNSTPTTEDILASTDGINYSPLQATYTNVPKLSLRAVVLFDDGCEMTLEDEVVCNIDNECDQFADIDVSVDQDCKLQITINTNYTDQLYEVLTVTVNGTSTTFDLLNASYVPIQLFGDGVYSIDYQAIFEDCPDVASEFTLQYDCDNVPTKVCEYDVEVNCKKDEDDCFFVSALSNINFDSIQAYYTLNGDNPLKADANGQFCGIPYDIESQVYGVGQFTVGYIIQNDGCQEHRIFCSAYIKPSSSGGGTIEIPNPLEVKVLNDKDCPIPIVDCTPSAGEDTKTKL